MQPWQQHLTGLAAPVSEEQLHFDLPVEGRLPAGLHGVYVRTGPNPHPARRAAPFHGLTSDGMVHGLRLAGGRALWYRNRWINSPELAGLRDLPLPRSVDAMVPDGTGNAATIVHAGRLYAFSDMALPYELSDALETLGTTDFGGPMPAGSIALPCRDPTRGELHTLASHPEPPYLRHHVVDAGGRLVETRPLPVERAAFVRAFGVTPEHLLLFDLPCLFSEDAIFEGAPLPYRWQADASAELLLLPRRGRAEVLERHALPACWVSELAAVRCGQDEIVLEAICRESLFAADTRDETDGSPGLYRITVDRQRGRVVREVADSTPQLHPCADPRVPLAEREVFWTLATDETAGIGLLRHVVGEDRASTHAAPRGWSLSAPTFVPAHGRSASNEGWLLCFAHRSDSAALFVYDATRPGAEPVARVQVPTRIPLGTRGSWFQLP